jgi:electron transfer flavoprotein alpha/beta subunit
MQVSARSAGPEISDEQFQAHAMRIGADRAQALLDALFDPFLKS